MKVGWVVSIVRGKQHLRNAYNVSAIHISQSSARRGNTRRHVTVVGENSTPGKLARLIPGVFCVTKNHGDATRKFAYQQATKNTRIPRI